MRAHHHLLSLVACAVVACGSSDGGLSGSGGASSQAGAPGASGAVGTAGQGSAGMNSAAGMNSGAGSSGAAGQGTTAGAGGMAVTGGAGGMAVTAGAGGAAGSAGAPAGGAGGAGGIGDDIPPWRELNITVTPGVHTHQTPAGHSAGMDNRSAKMAGKLVVDMGVGGGGYQAYLGKRGFHVVGIGDVNSCQGIDDWTLGRDFDTNCRLNTLDGLPHGNQNSVTPQQSIMNQVLQALITFEAQFPGEGWGYFLTKDGKAVRWGDVAFTGFSHGAQSAACFATQLRVWRVVPQSGPRDNTCGNGKATGPFDPAKPPWDPACPIGHIASWIDAKSATPIDRYWGFTGGNDGQFGDIMFTMERMKFVGDFVNVDTAKAPYGGSHRFYSLVAGHNGFPGPPPNGFPMDAINLAFGVLPENLNPTFN